MAQPCNSRTPARTTKVTLKRFIEFSREDRLLPELLHVRNHEYKFAFSEPGKAARTGYKIHSCLSVSPRFPQ
jgi:hypothetical protein